MTTDAQPDIKDRRTAATVERRIVLAEKALLLCIDDSFLLMDMTDLGQDKHRSGPPGLKPLDQGIYVHVPFCSSTCDFCAFYQIKPTAGAVDQFLKGIEAEAELIPWRGPISTVFWGGGTPGLLSPDDLDRLAKIIRKKTVIQPIEWSIELAPAWVTKARLEVLRDNGINRISMGIQSFSDELLDGLGRQHTPKQVYKAYELIREMGFKNVNVDMMFALPGQTEAEWLKDLEEAVALKPDHISTYCLTFEEDTALWIKLSEGRVKLDPEHEAKLYEATWEKLHQEGYQQYEVSNFAKPGFECRHNLSTWKMQEWIGLGPSAASQHDGMRGVNPADLALWSQQLNAGKRMQEDRRVLTEDLLLEDSLIFGLRVNQGVDLAQARIRFPDANWTFVEAKLSTLESEGLLKISSEVVRLTNKGRLLADSVGTELLGLGSD